MGPLRLTWSGFGLSIACAGCSATINVNESLNQAMMGAPRDTIAGQPVLTVSQLFSPAVYDRIAFHVQSRAPQHVAEGRLREVEDEFMRALVAGGYTVAARSDLDRVLPEQALQASSVTEQQLAEAGKVLSVAAVMLVSVNRVSSQCGTRYGNRYCYGVGDMSARMVSVSSGQVVWVGSVSSALRVGQESDADYAVGVAARRLASAFPDRRARPTPTAPPVTARAKRADSEPYLQWGVGAVRIDPSSSVKLPGAPHFAGAYGELGLAGLFHGVGAGTLRYGYARPLSQRDSTLRASSAQILNLEIAAGISRRSGALRAGAGIGQVFYPQSSRLRSDSISVVYPFAEAEVALTASVRLYGGWAFIPRQYIAGSSRVGAAAAVLGLRIR